jgi:hypothetical protein
LLAALVGAPRLLLLLLTGLLLPAALLLTTLVAGLIALLLLAGFLVGILVLIHSTSFQRLSFNAPHPIEHNAALSHLVPHQPIAIYLEPARESRSSSFNNQHYD